VELLVTPVAAGGGPATRWWPQWGQVAADMQQARRALLGPATVRTGVDRPAPGPDERPDVDVPFSL
jgi:hypothetical protein